ncbi:TetR/AcrR family transcriptional regulator [Streptomyces scabiei]|uniref:TetR/AcrR family transcriptional regulator n=1 Tax=Streptomyces scabiei TaxID=1930 RepID=UPI0029BC6185|nr:TetR/AcrR family transcriptional regulator [Streptomyces scabiei]MDX3277306.1 TetR/AcrR family transcriptional regulator [Streptomyces scabiei]
MEEPPGPRQRAAETKRRRTREAIVNGTLDLYEGQERGDYSLDQIAQAAGVSAATIANHYATKYEVLRAAYDRLLSPVIDTILEADRGGFYAPKDGVNELVRYVYRVAKLSHDSLALTVAMMRAYYDTPPASRDELQDRTTLLERKSVLLGGKIALGMDPIFKHPPFRVSRLGGVITVERGLNDWRTIHAATILLDGLYRTVGDDAPDSVTHEVVYLLLRATDVDTSGLKGRIERVKKREQSRAVEEA